MQLSEKEQLLAEFRESLNKVVEGRFRSFWEIAEFEELLKRLGTNKLGLTDIIRTLKSVLTRKKITVLTDNYEGYKSLVAALGYYDSPRAMDMLERIILKHGFIAYPQKLQKFIIMGAKRGLARMGAKGHARAIELLAMKGVYTFERDLLVEVGVSAAPVAARILASELSGSRLYVAMALRVIGDEKSLSPLEEAFQEAERSGKKTHMRAIQAAVRGICQRLGFDVPEYARIEARRAIKPSDTQRKGRENEQVQI